MQTAVDKLIEELGILDDSDFPPHEIELIKIKMFAQALAMEKEQIMTAWNDHKFNKWGNENTVVNGEEYYNQTYKP
jgi:hypothetical protein